MPAPSVDTQDPITGHTKKSNYLSILVLQVSNMNRKDL